MADKRKLQKAREDKRLMRGRHNPLKYDMNLIQKIAAVLEASNIEEFLDLRTRPLRLIYWNLVIGLFRGIGFFIGATVAGALLYTFMKHAVSSLGGLPWIGEKIANAVIYIGDLVREGMANKQ
jgi:hypothetical protein